MIQRVRAVMALKRDARNRALRTFIQGLFIDLLVAAAVTTWAIVNKNPDFTWAILGTAVGKSLLTTAAAYIMRLKLDPSAIPTPLPPDPPGAPAEPTVIGGHTIIPQEDGVADHGQG